MSAEMEKNRARRMRKVWRNATISYLVFISIVVFSYVIDVVPLEILILGLILGLFSVILSVKTWERITFPRRKRPF